MNAAEPSPVADRMPDIGRCLPSLRSQLAFVRALLDELERITPVGSGERPPSEPVALAVGDQLVDELTRLGARCIELASALTRDPRQQVRKI